MDTVKFVLTGLVLAVLAGLLVAAAWIIGGVVPDPFGAPGEVVRPPSTNAVAPVAAEPPQTGRLIFETDDMLAVIDPLGESMADVSPKRRQYTTALRLAPDGGRVAFMKSHAVSVSGPAPILFKNRLHVLKLDRRDAAVGDPGGDLGVDCEHIAWSPDGKRLAFTATELDPRTGQVRRKHGILDVETKAVSPLNLPGSHVLSDWTTDGERILTCHTATETAVGEAPRVLAQLHLVNIDGTGPRALTDAGRCCLGGRVSPDGTRVLYSGTSPTAAEDGERGAKVGDPQRLWVLDIASRRGTPVDVPANGGVTNGCWSPDGRRIAYTWRELHPPGAAPREIEARIIVSDPDGGNAMTIMTQTGVPQRTWLGHVDWR